MPITPEQARAELERRRRAAAKAAQDGEESDESEGEDQPSTLKESLYDFNEGASKGLVLGLDDVAAGAGAWAGDAYQSLVDGRPRDPTAYQQGVEEQRQRIAASAKRSPKATTAGEVGGALLTALVPVKAADTKKAKVALGSASGALSALGFGDSDTIEDAAEDAAKGAGTGAALTFVAPLVGPALAKVKQATPGLRTAAADLLAAATKRVDATDPLIRGGVALGTKGSSEVAVGAAKIAEKALRGKPVPVAKVEESLNRLTDEEFAALMQQMGD